MSKLIKSVRVKAGSLKFWQYLLGMRPIDTHVVSEYRQAMRVGKVFPALIVDVETKRVISGNHTLKAFLEEYGKNKPIAVEFHSFKNLEDILTVFAQKNVGHGLQLTGFTCKAITQAMIGIKMTHAQIAQILCMPVGKIIKMAGELVMVIGSKSNGIQYRKLLPVKNGLDHMVGQTMTQAVYDEHVEKDMGVDARQLVDQLYRWVDQNLIDRTDASIVNALVSLRKLLVRNGY